MRSGVVLILPSLVVTGDPLGRMRARSHLLHHPLTSPKSLIKTLRQPLKGIELRELKDPSSVTNPSPRVEPTDHDPKRTFTAA